MLRTLKTQLYTSSDEKLKETMQRRKNTKRFNTKVRSKSAPSSVVKRQETQNIKIEEKSNIFT